MNLIPIWRDLSLNTEDTDPVPLVIFREGTGGNYLKSLIEDSDQEIGFRIDRPHTITKPEYLVKTRRKYVCECKHLKDIDQHRVLSQYDPILTIQVHRKIYHAIYNNFHKKLIVENQDLATDFLRWQDRARFWYDTAFYNIKEYYTLFQQDREQNNFPNVVEFDHMLELRYIEKIFRQYLGRDLSDNIRHRVTAYAKLQLPYDLSGHQTNMEQIFEVIPDNEFERTPWFAAYCVFKYETANRLNENQRRWSIDAVDSIIDKQCLLNIARQYDHG